MQLIRNICRLVGGDAPGNSKYDIHISRAPFCLYTLRAISVRAEGTFGRLRYSLGGDRPSQTTRLTLSQYRITVSG